MHGKADAAFVPVDPEDSTADCLPCGEHFRQRESLVTVNFGDVAKPFNSRRELDEDTEIRNVRDLARRYIADSVRVGVLLPLIGE